MGLIKKEMHPIDRDYVRWLLPARGRDSHKGDFGRILIVAGGAGMTGAAILAAKGALRSGSGLVYVCIPEEYADVLRIAVPEAIVVKWGDALAVLDGSVAVKGITPDRYDAVCFGPGMGKSAGSRTQLRAILRVSDAPLIIDADGLNLISENKDIKDLVLGYKGDIAVTPHYGEAMRLVSGSKPAGREEMARMLSYGYDCTAVLKGSGTLVFSRDDEFWINTTGNPGMAAAGSGDVLSGIMTSLAGQGLQVPDAARTAVFIHGLAGDMAASEKGEYGMTASDIAEYTAYAIKEIVGR